MSLPSNEWVYRVDLVCLPRRSGTALLRNLRLQPEDRFLALSARS
jgi:hypothetical protein